MHGSFDYRLGAISSYIYKTIEVTDKLIEENEFDADQKDAFKTMSERQKKRPCRNE
ncbi:hypothetical protein AAG906_013205 [Vitis piasezkii]